MEKITYSTAIEQFNDFLDETHDNIVICGLHYLPSTVFTAVDEIAYEQELLNWADANGMVIV